MKVLVVGGGEFAHSIIKVLDSKKVDIYSIDKFSNKYLDLNVHYLDYYDIDNQFDVVFFAISDLTAAKENRDYINQKCVSKLSYGVWSESHDEMLFIASSLLKRRIFVHIGGPKTATTHIQNVLAANSDTLSENDLLYMQRNVHFSQFINTKDSEKTKIEILNKMSDFFIKNPNKHVITSDEDFYTMLHSNAFKDFVSLLEIHFSEIHFMFTIRPQWELLESCYITDKLNGMIKSKKKYVEDYICNEKEMLDYKVVYKYLKAASAKVVGIKIANFSTFSNNEIVHNMLKFVKSSNGMKAQPIIRIPPTKYNPTLKAEVIDYINKICIPNTSYHAYLKQVAWQNKSLHAGAIKCEFNIELQQKIFDVYKEENDLFFSDIYMLNNKFRHEWERPSCKEHETRPLIESEISEFLLKTAFEKKSHLNTTIW